MAIDCEWLHHRAGRRTARPMTVAVSTLCLCVWLAIVLESAASFAWRRQSHALALALAPPVATASTCLHQTSSDSSSFLSIQECLTLYENRNDAEGRRVKFVDGTWFHKGDRVGRNEFERNTRIPSSVYFDIDDVSASNLNVRQSMEDGYDETTGLSLQHMLPSPILFAAAMGAFNISKHNHVIIYGRRGHSFLPRVWFTFHVMGQHRVSIMEGCLEDWIDLDGPIDSSVVTIPKAVDIMDDWRIQLNSNASRSHHDKYPKSLLPNTVATKEHVLEALNANETAKGATVLLDARGFSYQRQGHIPGSIHIPYKSLQASSGMRKPTDELLDLFQKAGVDPHDESKAIVCTCGSGVSACSIFLALWECGRRTNTFVYDGSWDEWSKDGSLPKVLPSS